MLQKNEWIKPYKSFTHQLYSQHISTTSYLVKSEDDVIRQGLSSVHIILFLVHSLFCLLSLRSGWLATQFNSFDSASARNKKEQAFYISQAWASWIRLLKRECKISSVNFHVVVWWLFVLSFPLPFSGLLNMMKSTSNSFFVSWQLWTPCKK